MASGYFSTLDARPRMKGAWLRRVLLCGCTGVCLWLALFGSAVVSAQLGTLLPETPVRGTVASDGTQTWQFSALDGAILSFIAAPDGDFDPVLTIASADGTALLANDDYHAPDRTALLQAVTIPRSGTYTANVTGFAGQSGSYTLTMLPGYASPAYSEEFETDTGWRSTNNQLALNLSDSRLSLSLTGVQVSGVARQAAVPVLSDYYAETVVASVNGRDGWIVGLTLREQNNSHYLFTINSDGLWRVVLQAGVNEFVLRDWTAHPAIVAGQSAFRFGALLNGARLEFFYNGQYIGQVTDSRLLDGGTTGLAVVTPNVLNGQTNAAFERLTLTAPLLVDGAEIFPQQLSSSSPAALAQELERRRVIPPGGQLIVTIEQSFAEFASEGVSRIMLARGSSYANFVLGASVTWQSAAAGLTGCGLVFRNTGDTAYTLAYVDQQGGFGLSRREGEIFEPGVYGTGRSFGPGAVNLLVVALQDRLYYFINEQFVGQLDSPAVSGGIGIAVVNYEPITTNCQFASTWLWTWE